MRKLARLSVFVIGYVVVNQIGYFIVQLLAYGQRGGYTAYVYAFTFFMLPHGLFAVSVITALLPGLSELAVEDGYDQFRQRMSLGIRTTMLLVLPAAVGYLILGEAIIRILLEHGVMTGASTSLVADVLRIFVLGLVPFSVFQLFLRAFYALQDTKTPFLINCIAMMVNIAINIVLFDRFGVQGLAAGHALSYLVGVVLQARSLGRRIGGLGSRELVGSGARILAAAAGMGAVVWATWDVLAGGVQGATFVRQTLLVAVPVIAGIASYLGLAMLLRVPELAFIRSVVARRASGSR